MTNVCRLTPRERAPSDVERIVALADPNASSRPGEWLGPELEALAQTLSGVAAAYREGRMLDAGRDARAAARRAEALGLNRIARVARTTCVLSGQRDSNALAANVARLLRLGDDALMAIWSLQDERS